MNTVFSISPGYFIVSLCIVCIITIFLMMRQRQINWLQPDRKDDASITILTDRVAFLLDEYQSSTWYRMFFLKNHIEKQIVKCLFSLGQLIVRRWQEHEDFFLGSDVLSKLYPILSRIKGKSLAQPFTQGLTIELGTIAGSNGLRQAEEKIMTRYQHAIGEAIPNLEGAYSLLSRVCNLFEKETPSLLSSYMTAAAEGYNVLVLESYRKQWEEHPELLTWEQIQTLLSVALKPSGTTYASLQVCYNQRDARPVRLDGLLQELSGSRVEENAA